MPSTHALPLSSALCPFQMPGCGCGPRRLWQLDEPRRVKSLFLSATYQQIGFLIFGGVFCRKKKKCTISSYNTSSSMGGLVIARLQSINQSINPSSLPTSTRPGPWQKRRKIAQQGKKETEQRAKGRTKQSRLVAAATTPALPTLARPATQAKALDVLRKGTCFTDRANPKGPRISSKGHPSVLAAALVMA